MSFAIEVYRRVAAAGGNVVLSPYSIAVALRMLLAGARGETAAEIARVVPSAPGAVSGILSANRLWVMEGYPLHADFLAIAPAEAVNFARSKAAAARINGWVSEQTRGKIADLVPPELLDELTRVVITNAVYLKALWEEPFTRTRDDTFHVSADRDVPVKMMVLSGTRLAAAAIPGGRVFELPYRDGELSMHICLPDAVDGLAAIEESLDPSAWRLTQRDANVFLPRFGAEMSLDLQPLLEAMGIRQAFGDEADLSGITDMEELYVSAALHKARIDVDEQGTEAAAATAVVILARSARPAPPPREEFRVDRPFLFLIRAKSGEIVFIGRVVDPTE